MENPPAQSQRPGHFQQVPLRNDTLVLILGIVSIILSCNGIFGIALSIVAITVADQSLRDYKLSPRAYTVSSVNNVNTGRTCAIIGLVISSMVLLFILAYFLFYIMMIGAVFTAPFLAY